MRWSVDVLGLQLPDFLTSSQLNNVQFRVTSYFSCVNMDVDFAGGTVSYSATWLGKGQCGAVQGFQTMFYKGQRRNVTPDLFMALLECLGMIFLSYSMYM